MRKIQIVIVLLASFNLHSAPAFGYSLAPVGVVTPSGSYGGLTASFIFSPYPDVHAGDIRIGVDLSAVYPFFESASLLMSMPVFSTPENPFSWAFMNPVLWTPSISLGVQYRLHNEWNMILGLSPLAFRDSHFIYEALSPFALYSILSGEWGWGIYVFRFSYFF